MSLHSAYTVPELAFDDGVIFVFKITFGGTWWCGFMHRPIRASEFPPSGGVVTPPVNWTQDDNLNSWVETIKYAARNQVPININFDDEISITYLSWSEQDPTGGGAEEAIFQQVYSVTG